MAGAWEKPRGSCFELWARTQAVLVFARDGMRSLLERAAFLMPLIIFLFQEAMRVAPLLFGEQALCCGQDLHDGSKFDPTPPSSRSALSPHRFRVVGHSPPERCGMAEAREIEVFCFGLSCAFSSGPHVTSAVGMFWELGCGFDW
eukprot:RCo019962